MYLCQLYRILVKKSLNDLIEISKVEIKTCRFYVLWVNQGSDIVNMIILWFNVRYTREDGINKKISR